MYFNENWSAEICPLNRGNPLNRGPLNRGFTVDISSVSGFFFETGLEILSKKISFDAGFEDVPQKNCNLMIRHQIAVCEG